MSKLGLLSLVGVFVVLSGLILFFFKGDASALTCCSTSQCLDYSSCVYPQYATSVSNCVGVVLPCPPSNCGWVGGAWVCTTGRPGNCSATTCCSAVNGGWSGWSNCYVGGGPTCLKDRACRSPYPACGGADCVGDSWVACTAADAGCSNASCPSYCGYTGGSVNDGTVNQSTCGCGTKTCPAVSCCTPSCGDTNNYCSGTSYSDGCSGTCYGTKASVNGVWGSWSGWSSCSSCSQSRTRSCATSASCGGTGCTSGQTDTGTQACGTVAGSWSACSGCTSTCVGASCGGTCPGSAPSCAVNGGWSVCPALACGQARICNNPALSCGGAVCDPATGTCPTTSAVIPGQVGITFPAGTAVNPTVVSSPISLRWSNNETNHASTDYYEYRLYNTTAGVWVAGGAASGVNVGGPTTTSFSVAGTVGSIYYWQVRAVNSACAGLPAGTVYGAWSAAGYFRINSPPQVVSLVIKNSALAVATTEPGSRNQICQTVFSGTANPRRVTFELTVSDPDGCADLNTAQLKWNNITYNLALNNCVGTVTVDYTGVNNPGVFQIDGTVTDDWAATSGWIDTTRNWKVWNCQVPLSGSMYDSSSQGSAVCSSGVGFSDLATAAMNFKSVTIAGGTAAVINATGGNTYSGATLIWGKNHTIVPNVDLSASGQVTRWLDMSSGSPVYRSCGPGDTVDQTMVDAYGASPVLRVDMSALTDQNPWFQAAGGGIFTKASINTMIPVTCDSGAGCTPAMTINSVSGTNGLVAGPAITNSSGCVLGSCSFYGSPNNWGLRNNVIGDNYGYQYFYDNYFVKTGLGYTISGNATMTQIVANAGGTGVVLVNGNVNIDTNNTLNTGKFFMVVASGQITIAENVVQTEGILVAGLGIGASGSNATQLKINGVVYAAGGAVSFSRGYTTQTDNNTSPAVLVTYRPDLIFSLPATLSKVLTSWSLAK